MIYSEKNINKCSYLCQPRLVSGKSREIIKLRAGQRASDRRQAKEGYGVKEYQKAILLVSPRLEKLIGEIGQCVEARARSSYNGRESAHRGDLAPVVRQRRLSRLAREGERGVRAAHAGRAVHARIQVFPQEKEAGRGVCGLALQLLREDVLPPSAQTGGQAEQPVPACGHDGRMVCKDLFGRPVHDEAVGKGAPHGGKFGAGQARPHRIARERRAAGKAGAGGGAQVKRSSSSRGFSLRGWKRKYSAPSAVTTSAQTSTTFNRPELSVPFCSSVGAGVSSCMCSVLGG